MNSLRTNPAVPASNRDQPQRCASVRAGLLLLAASCSVVGCASPGGSFPRDVGSMAYPAPLQQGAIATTSNFGRAPFDTGSMAFPEPSPQGVIGRTTAPQQAFDTGNMAYPAALPQGTLATTVVR